MVMGGDWNPVGCEFESQHHILDGHFCNVYLKRLKINEIEAEDGPFKPNLNMLTDQDMLGPIVGRSTHKCFKNRYNYYCLMCCNRLYTKQ